MRALHHLRALHPDKVRLDSKEGIEAALQQVHLQLEFYGIIQFEVIAGTVRGSKFYKLWLWLQLVAMQGAWVPLSMVLPFTGLYPVGRTVERVLSDVPFFAADYDNNRIKLARCGLAERAVLRELAHFHSEWSELRFWQNMEEVVVQAWLRVMVAAANLTEQTWGDACFFLDHPDVPECVRTEVVRCSVRGTLAPSQSISKLFTDGNHTPARQDTLQRQLSLAPGTVVNMLPGSSGPDITVTAESFNLHVQCKHGSKGSPTGQLSARTLVEELAKSQQLGDAARGKHQVLVMCSTQPPAGSVQQLLDCHHATNLKSAEQQQQQQLPYEMAVLKPNSITTVGDEYVAVPEHWTLVVLGEAATKELCSRGAIAAQFQTASEMLEKAP